jgi:hypothetical protein
MIKKWTSATEVARWYDLESFGNLLRSKIAADEVASKRTTLREYLAVTFRGMSGSAKPAQVASDAGLKGEYVADLLDNQQRLRQDPLQRLLVAMQEASATMKPEQLGVLGEPHFRGHLVPLYSDSDVFRQENEVSERGRG